MSLTQAAAIGHRASVTIIAETRSRSFVKGDPLAPEWNIVCRGTGFLLRPLHAAGKLNQRFHVITCGHVALPHKFAQLYGEKGGTMLNGLKPKDMRVRVEVRGDVGGILFSAVARGRKYASDSLMDDIAVMHLSADDEGALLRTQAGAGLPVEPLELHPGASATDDASVIPPVTPGDDVMFSTYALLKGNEVYKGTTAQRLSESYNTVLGDINIRRGDHYLPYDMPFSMIPTVHKGRVQDLHRFFTAVDARPQTMSAHSGSALVHLPSERVVGHMVRIGIPDDSPGATEKVKGSRIRPAGGFVPGREWEGALSDDARLELEEGYTQGCGLSEVTMFTPGDRLRAFVSRVEKAMVKAAAA